MSTTSLRTCGECEARRLDCWLKGCLWLFLIKKGVCGGDSVLGRSIYRGSSFVGQLAIILYLNLDILIFAIEIFHSFYL